MAWPELQSTQRGAKLGEPIGEPSAEPSGDLLCVEGRTSAAPAVFGGPWPPLAVTPEQLSNSSCYHFIMEQNYLGDLLPFSAFFASLSAQHLW